MLLSNHEIYEEDIKSIIDSDLPWEKLYGKYLLITGATGMIGKTLIDIIMCKNMALMTDKKIHIIAMGRSKEKAKERLAEYFELPYFQFVEHDINNSLECVEKKLGIVNYIIHGASTTHPVAYATEPVQTITANVMGLNYLLDYAGKNKIERFVFLSSVEVYGENRGDTVRFSENYCGYIDCNAVRAGYPESKRLGEALCQAYAKQYGINIVIPRLSRVYGPTMQQTDSKAIAQFIKKAKNKENIVLKSEGNQLYSYCYVSDAAAGILTVLLKGENGEAYNISDEKSEITLKELAQELADLAGCKVIFELPDKTEQSGYSKATKALLDTAKLRELGWKAGVHMEEGLGRSI